MSTTHIDCVINNIYLHDSKDSTFVLFADSNRATTNPDMASGLLRIHKEVDYLKSQPAYIHLSRNLHTIRLFYKTR